MLNFETKHVIRWGLPGWVFLMSIIIYIFAYNPNFLEGLKIKDGLSIVGLVAFLGGVGVPIGYLIHQVSMFFGFILFTKRKEFFESEYQLDTFFNKDAGEKFRKRYIHLLTRIHELRALSFSLGLSSLTIFLSEVIKVKNYSLTFWIIIGINLMLCIIVTVNYKYFKDNLSYLSDRLIESNQEDNSTLN